MLHQEHQILSTAEATAFATQFWDCKEPSKAIKMKFEKFLQALPQAENRFSDAAWPSTEMVHLAPVGGRRASAYNMWIHWLQKEEADQSAKRGKADFKPQISLKTAQSTMQTVKLGYQVPMKDTCAECELYNLQIRSKVQLTKKRNVDLTADGLWAMPLNTGWVPVKKHRLQD